MVTLKTNNPGVDRLGATHFLTLRDPCSGFDPYLGTTGVDQLANNCVKLRRQVAYFLRLQQSRGDN